MAWCHPHKHKALSALGYLVPKTICAWLVCGFLSFALLNILYCSLFGTQESVLSPFFQYLDDTYSVSSETKNCSYSQGKWVRAPGYGRRYNATLCNAKETHNCIRNGRPDTGYLDWRWQPAGCRLPAFHPRAFLSAVRGKHVAFVGDSMARNQAQSLVCLLGSAYPHRVVYRDPDPSRHDDFWRWAFPSHGVTVSFYWAPFVARATGKARNESMAQNVNHVDLGALDERWAADADSMDVVVLGIGHWLLNGAIYYNGTELVGAHGHPEIAKAAADLGYATPMRLAYRKAFERLGMDAGRPRSVVLATFSPAHFEGNTSTTACPRKEPYKEGEAQLRPVEEELRAIMFEEAAAATGKGGGALLSVDVLDVTKLAIMRPDGHPGPYRYPGAVDRGVLEWIAPDCLHFCLPGPVDTFNEILQQMLRKKRR